MVLQLKLSWLVCDYLRKLSQTCWSGVGNILKYHELTWFVSEIPTEEKFLDHSTR